MMRRIDLLPSSYADRRKQRRTVALVIVIALAVFALQFAYWFSLDGQIGDAEDDLVAARAQNTKIQTRINELQRFADLAVEVQAKKQSLRNVMQGDLDWPAIMTEVALVVPGEVWLTNLTASSGVGEGSTAVGTETAPVDINAATPTGRIQFSGKSLNIPGVAKWLLRLAGVSEFDAIYLTSANEAPGTEDEPAETTFESSLELNRKALSLRYQGEDL